MTDLDNGADLRERMDHATSELSAPDHLTSVVLADGRRLRRRRRVLTVATGTAAAAVVAALVVASLGGDASTTGADVATQPTPTPTSESSASPRGETPSPWDGGGEPFPEAPPGWWDAPGHLLASQLQVHLPDGVSVVRTEEDTGWLHGELDAPTGPGGFEVILYPPDPDKGRDNLARSRCGKQARYTDTCEEIDDADGKPVGRVATFLQGQVTFYEATLLGPEGGLVHLGTWNSTDEKPGDGTEPSAERPPLTPDQLRELVQDPAWTSYRP